MVTGEYHYFVRWKHSIYSLENVQIIKTWAKNNDVSFMDHAGIAILNVPPSLDNCMVEFKLAFGDMFEEITRV